MKFIAYLPRLVAGAQLSFYCLKSQTKSHYTVNCHLNDLSLFASQLHSFGVLSKKWEHCVLAGALNYPGQPYYREPLQATQQEDSSTKKLG